MSLGLNQKSLNTQMSQGQVSAKKLQAITY